MSIRSQVITSSHALMKGDTVMVEDRRGLVDTENGEITVVDLRIERSIQFINSRQRQDAIYYYARESHTRQEYRQVPLNNSINSFDNWNAIRTTQERRNRHAGGRTRRI